MNFSNEDGIRAVRIARSVAEAETQGNLTDPEFSDVFKELSGVFVTISEYPSGNLRGCIGYSEPVVPLAESLVKSSRAACHDPRFMPLTLEEAKACTFEVTKLTTPAELKFNNVDEMLNQIVLGRDGVIMEYRGNKAVYLPQVATEQGWTKQEMMFSLSEKAGLHRGAWTYKGTRIWTFHGEIFKEVSPCGDVVRE